MEKLQLTKDPVLQRDLEEIADSEMIQWERFRGKTILITGATGLIGSQASMALTLAGKKRDLNLKVLALVRNKEKAEKIDWILEMGIYDSRTSMCYLVYIS